MLVDDDSAVREVTAGILHDLGYGVVEAFAKRFPNRFFNAGVAEQNMTGLAAGMASEGYHVFTYSIANGIGVGFISWVVLHAASGGIKKIHPLLWIVAALFVAYFTVGPITDALT